MTATEVKKLVSELCANCEFVRDICFDGYAEPGYTDPESGIIVTADWNDDTPCVPTSSLPDWPGYETMITLGDALEFLGVELEWSDEWDACGHCGKLFRTQPDSYQWRASYWYDENQCEYICCECVRRDPSDYIEFCNGNARTAIQIDIDPADHGYTLHMSGMDRGWHNSQTADPETIALDLRARGIYDFVFKIDEKYQFTTVFSVWVKSQEIDS